MFLLHSAVDVMNENDSLRSKIRSYFMICYIDYVEQFTAFISLNIKSY